MKLKHHLFVCMNQRPAGHPRGSCGGAGAGSVFEALMAEVEKRGLFEQIMVTGTFCMGPCDKGPTVVVYPDGVWYGGVKPKDIPEIFDEHLTNGEPVKRLRIM
ncbi:MAG: (2Fe-2S) ferredoxin domain-containing protein [Magnetococcales bacterium]|nr:(2Fe-2S) ferredoxin domain-containing protein [Magnetococcales bacterium]